MGVSFSPPATSMVTREVWSVLGGVLSLLSSAGAWALAIPASANSKKAAHVTKIGRNVMWATLQSSTKGLGFVKCLPIALDAAGAPLLRLGCIRRTRRRDVGKKSPPPFVPQCKQKAAATWQPLAWLSYIFGLNLAEIVDNWTFDAVGLLRYLLLRSLRCSHGLSERGSAETSRTRLTGWARRWRRPPRRSAVV